MRLKDIFEVQESLEYKEIFNNLKEKYGKGEFRNLNIKDFCENEECSRHSGYAKVTYTGKLKEYVELTELELSMICDNGYSHFGGSSFIDRDRGFSVTIYTD